jgi:hypothetical protein
VKDRERIIFTFRIKILLSSREKFSRITTPMETSEFWDWEGTIK